MNDGTYRYGYDFCQYGDELCHYGVLGMKWGVRRTPTELGHKPKKAKKKSGGLLGKKTKKKSKAKKKVPAITKETDPVKSMTNDELRARIERANLEKQYRALSPAKISKGEAFTKHVMNNIVVPAATDAGKTVVKEFLIKQGRAYLGMNNNGGGNNNQNGNRS